MLTLLSPLMHVAVVIMCALFAIMSGTESTTEFLGQTFVGQAGVFVGCLIRWFIACGFVEFVMAMGYGFYGFLKK